MKILITGVTGFIGGHLVEHLTAHGYRNLVGLARSGTSTIPLHLVDLSDQAGLTAAVHQEGPDWVIHLAGYASAGKSFEQPAACWQANLDGTRSLYDAIVAAQLTPRILFISTGLVYGDPVGADVDCDESCELRPASPYAASKAAADLLSYQYTRRPGLDIVRVRLFNQIGPRQSADYAIANFARQIALVEAGQLGVIETGNLSAQRDLTDVRDIVSAFRLLLEHGQTGEVYNAGRGQTWSMQAILDKLIGLATVPIEVRQKPNAFRQTDTATTRVNAAKLRATTGWQPHYSIEQTLHDTLNDWRSRTR